MTMGRNAAAVLLFWLAAPQTGSGPANPTSYKAGAEPTCDQSRRGALIVTLGATGYPDLLQVCLRDGTGRYAWTTAGNHNRNSFAHTRMAGPCPVFPDNNIWNSTIDKLPLVPESAAITNTYAGQRLGTVPAFWLNMADSKTPSFPIMFGTLEADGGRYPITGNMRMEGSSRESVVSGGPYPGSDSHILVLQTDECKLYEIFALEKSSAPFKAGSGAIFDLTSNSLRPDGWTSADAAGLPIWPGVLTYPEVYSEGEIRHMVRFTVDKTRASYVWPARHYASRNGDAALPPMGSRWRLKASVDENTCHFSDNNGKPYPPEMKRLMRALKHYGMILADNGLAIRITTDADARWGNPNSPNSAEWVFNGWTHCLTGKDFEVVDQSGMMVNRDSAEVAK